MNHNDRNSSHQHRYQKALAPAFSSQHPNPFHHPPSPSPPPAGRAIISTPRIGLFPPTPGGATFEEQLCISARNLIQAQFGLPLDHQLSAPVAPNQPSNSPLGLQLGATPLPARNPSPKASHAKKQPEGHIKRPRNAFILFRCWVVKSGLLNGVETDHRKISKIVGRIWNNLRQDEKAKFEQDAREEKDRHYQLHPDYRYAPSYRKDGSSSTKSSKAGSPSSSRRRVKGPMNSREEKRVKLIAKLVTGGAGRDGVRQRVKDFDRGVLDLCDDGDSEMCSEYRDGDEDSDFEDGLSKKKAKRAHARRAAKKKTIALPSLPPPLPVTEHDLPTSDHPVMPSAHSMATRRRSLSTPSLPTVPAIASSVRRPKAHARTYSDIAAAPRSGIRISKGRTTNNSLSAPTAFAHVPMDGESSDDEYSFDYGTHSGREQKRKGEKKAKMQKESSAHVETRPTTPFTLSHPPTPLTFLGSTTPISSQSTPLSATPSLGYRTPSPDPGTSAFNSPSIGVGWSLNSDFLNPPSSSSEARGSGSQLLEEDLRMYDTLGLDEGPSSLLDEFGLGVFGELSGLNSTGEVYDASYLLQDHYLISGHEAGPMEGVKVPTTRNSLSEAISRFRFPPEAVGTPESASIFDPAYPLSAPMNTTILVSSPALNPVEPSPAPEFDYWLNEDYFLSPSRGDETLDGGEQEDDLEAYRRGMDAARSAALETF